MNSVEQCLEEDCCDSQGSSYRRLSSKKQNILFSVLQRVREDFHCNVFIFLTQRNSPGLISLQQSVGVEHTVCGGPELFDMSGSDSSKACLLKFVRMVVTLRI